MNNLKPEDFNRKSTWEVTSDANEGSSSVAIGTFIGTPTQIRWWLETQGNPKKGYYYYFTEAKQSPDLSRITVPEGYSISVPCFERVESNFSDDLKIELKRIKHVKNMGKVEAQELGLWRDGDEAHLA